MRLITTTKGVSLPIAVSLVLLLMVASAAVNGVVIRTLRSVHQIEASNRAYMAAEAGVEDALYELSAHFAGYQTPDLGNPCNEAGVPQADFNPGGDVCWKNSWTIQSRNLSEDCGSGIELCGQINRRRKLVISLFNDEGMREAEDIQTLDVNAFLIRFSVPQSIILASDDNNAAFDRGLIIDNDEDWGGNMTQVNEDGELDNGSCAVGPGARSPVTSRDADCDGREDEDSNEDPVIHWKITDGAGLSLVPKRGCLNEIDPDLPLGSELCEKEFLRVGDEVFTELNETAIGVREDGSEETIETFLGRYDTLNTEKLQMEFLMVAPLEQVDEFGQRKISIPYLEYEVDYDAGGETIPDPFFVIQSDGWYRDFKQSITTTLTPKTTVPLFDFTIIQQQ